MESKPLLVPVTAQSVYVLDDPPPPPRKEGIGKLFLLFLALGLALFASIFIWTHPPYDDRWIRASLNATVTQDLALYVPPPHDDFASALQAEDTLMLQRLSALNLTLREFTVTEIVEVLALFNLTLPSFFVSLATPVVRQSITTYNTSLMGMVATPPQVDRSIVEYNTTLIPFLEALFADQMQGAIQGYNTSLVPFVQTLIVNQNNLTEVQVQQMFLLALQTYNTTLLPVLMQLVAAQLNDTTDAALILLVQQQLGDLNSTVRTWALQTFVVPTALTSLNSSLQSWALSMFVSQATFNGLNTQVQQLIANETSDSLALLNLNTTLQSWALQTFVTPMALLTLNSSVQSWVTSMFIDKVTFDNFVQQLVVNETVDAQALINLNISLQSWASQTFVLPAALVSLNSSVQAWTSSLFVDKITFNGFVQQLLENETAEAAEFVNLNSTLQSWATQQFVSLLTFNASIQQLQTTDATLSAVQQTILQSLAALNVSLNTTALTLSTVIPLINTYIADLNTSLRAYVVDDVTTQLDTLNTSLRTWAASTFLNSTQTLAVVETFFYTTCQQSCKGSQDKVAPSPTGSWTGSMGANAIESAGTVVVSSTTGSSTLVFSFTLHSTFTIAPILMFQAADLNAATFLPYYLYGACTTTTCTVQTQNTITGAITPATFSYLLQPIGL